MVAPAEPRRVEVRPAPRPAPVATPDRSEPRERAAAERAGGDPTAAVALAVERALVQPAAQRAPPPEQAVMETAVERVVVEMAAEPTAGGPPREREALPAVAVRPAQVAAPTP